MTHSDSLTHGGAKRLYAIEVARGVASMGVMFFHSLARFHPQDLHPALHLVQNLTHYGWLGVDVFFVLSGWCIAERLATARRRDESAVVFMRERALRIFPTYWAVLALTWAARLAAVPFNHTTFSANLPSGSLSWIGDLLLIQPYLDVPASLGVSWTLVCELAFYALASGILVLGPRALPTFAVALLGLVLCLWPLLGLNLRIAFVLDRWPEFFMGVLGWWGARAGRSPDRWLRGSLLGLAFLLMIGLARSASALEPCVALSTAIALWLASKREQGIAPKPFVRVLTGVGAISYPLYLIHFSVLFPVLNLAERFVRPSETMFCAVWCVAIALSFIAALCVHRCVEFPAERWRKRRWTWKLATA